MKCFVLMVACAMCAVSVAVPVPSQEEVSVVQIPLAGNKEIDILSLAAEDSQLNERNKRTIGILRELFPELSKIVERKIQMLIPIVLRTVGPILLRSGLGGLGGAGAGASNNNDSDDDDDDDDDDEDDSKSGNASSVSNSNGSKVSISLPTFAPDTDDDDDDENETSISGVVVSSTSSVNLGETEAKLTADAVTDDSESAGSKSSANIDYSIFDTNFPAVGDATADSSSAANSKSDTENVKDSDGAESAPEPYIYEMAPKPEDCEDAQINSPHDSNLV